MSPKVGANIVAVLFLAGLLAGCEPAGPTGQVIARVDGEEITLRDLQIEFAASGLPADIDLKSVQPALLEQIIARKLLAAEARRTGIDRTPDYLAAMRRDREILLVDHFRARTEARAGQPADPEIQRFIAANAARFDNRRLIVVDRIQTSARGIDLALLRAAPSADAAARLIEAAGHGIRRGPVTFDTLTEPVSITRAMEAQPVGSPVLRIGNGILTIDAVMAIREMPVAKPERLEVAKALLRTAGANSEISDAVGGLRGAARIEYQPGFGP